MLELIPPCYCEGGIFILTDDMKSGFTTGSCATAALKAAIILWQGEDLPKKVFIKNPQDQELSLEIAGGELLTDGARAWVIKDAGDDPDVTHGAKIEVTFLPDQTKTEFQLVAGAGVGTVTKAGLNIPLGEPAINSGPRKMLTKVLTELLPKDFGGRIIIGVENGETIAKRTLNSTLGIVGGISIIGTTGIVHPMSEEAFKDSLVPQFKVLKTSGADIAILTPGKIGADIATDKFALPIENMIQTSNFIGFMLEQAVHIGFEKVLLFGHIGKLIKVAGGIFHTHSHVADARQEILVANLARLGASKEVLDFAFNATTTEAVFGIIEEHGLQEVYNLLAIKASERAKAHVYGELIVGTVLVSMQGQAIGMDETAKILMSELKSKNDNK